MALGNPYEMDTGGGMVPTQASSAGQGAQDDMFSRFLRLQQIHSGGMPLQMPTGGGFAGGLSGGASMLGMGLGMGMKKLFGGSGGAGIPSPVTGMNPYGATFNPEADAANFAGP